MEQFNSLTQLATTAGTVAVVTLIVQYIKQFIPEKIPIRLVVLLLCALIQIGIAVIFTPSLEPILLAIVNSFVAAAACMGSYEVVFNKDKEENSEE